MTPGHARNVSCSPKQPASNATSAKLLDLDMPLRSSPLRPRGDLPAGAPVSLRPPGLPQPAETGLVPCVVASRKLQALSATCARPRNNAGIVIYSRVRSFGMERHTHLVTIITYTTMYEGRAVFAAVERYNQSSSRMMMADVSTTLAPFGIAPDSSFCSLGFTRV